MIEFYIDETRLASLDLTSPHRRKAAYDRKTRYREAFSILRMRGRPGAAFTASSIGLADRQCHSPLGLQPCIQ
jgi:hypothetical protein